MSKAPKIRIVPSTESSIPILAPIGQKKAPVKATKIRIRSPVRTVETLVPIKLPKFSTSIPPKPQEVPTTLVPKSALLLVYTPEQESVVFAPRVDITRISKSRASERVGKEGPYTIYQLQEIAKKLQITISNANKSELVDAILERLNPQQNPSY